MYTGSGSEYRLSPAFLPASYPPPSPSMTGYGAGMQYDYD